jgi:IMP dehydrogenase
VDLDSLSTGLTFDDVLLQPRRSSVRSRQDVSLATSICRGVELDIPIISANMDTVTESAMASAMAELGGAGIVHRFCSIERQVEMVRASLSNDEKSIVGAAVGTDHDMAERADAVCEAGASVLVLDVAHGHSEHVIASTRELATRYPNVGVIAGNVATYSGAADLAEAGADAIKVGIGPGGVCTTRIVAGVGVPQLSAIAACASAGVPVIADGGIRNSGDIAKALAVGASTVMIGSLFAGTKQSPGDVEQTDRGLVKRVRGMASFEAVSARAQRQGEPVDAEYFEQRTPEGVEGVVAYRGEVSKLVGQLLAGLKSAMSYSDARTIPEFWDRAEMIRVTPIGLAENGPHTTY